jgi:hypothetical protein
MRRINHFIVLLLENRSSSRLRFDSARKRRKSADAELFARDLLDPAA